VEEMEMVEQAHRSAGAEKATAAVGGGMAGVVMAMVAEEGELTGATMEEGWGGAMAVVQVEVVLQAARTVALEVVGCTTPSFQRSANHVPD
jgi:hypothetical protein